MKTIRNIISDIRSSLKEVNADSNLTNKLIWSKILDVSTLFIQRESDSLRLPYALNSYQTIKCVDVVEVPAIDPCCKITNNVKLFRTKGKLPDMYSDSYGPIIKGIRTIDGSKTLEMITIDSLNRSKKDVNSKYDKTIYAFYSEGYIYLTKKIPISIEGMFIYDITSENFCGCEDNLPCKRFMDGVWFIPEKLQHLIIQEVVKDLASVYKRIPEQKINKTENA